MKKFRCTVCGYVYEGDAAPEKCPLCKAPASKFVEVEEAHILPYTQVGGKILYRASDIEKTLMKGYKEAYRK